MEKQLLLEKLLSILNPISDVILFLFTTKIGILITVLSIIIFVNLYLSNKIKERKLLLNNNTISFKDYMSLVLNELLILFGKFVTNFGNILISLIILLTIVGLTTSLSTVNEYFQNIQKIKELKQALKNLNVRYKIATITVINYNPHSNISKLHIDYYNYDKNIVNKQDITILGSDIYFLTYVINFEYSIIENNTAKNIAIPYKIFSECVPQSKGIILNVNNKNNIPYIYERTNESLYGITEEDYNEQLNYILTIVNNENESKESGIRSYYASSPHYVKSIQSGTKYSIYIEQTGGLTIKEEEEW